MIYTPSEPAGILKSAVQSISCERQHVQECMRKLFFRIDANGDGKLDWDEFSLYMLLENQVCCKDEPHTSTLRALVRPTEICERV